MNPHNLSDANQPSHSKKQKTDDQDSYLNACTTCPELLEQIERLKTEVADKKKEILELTKKNLLLQEGLPNLLSFWHYELLRKVQNHASELNYAVLDLSAARTPNPNKSFDPGSSSCVSDGSESTSKAVSSFYSEQRLKLSPSNHRIILDEGKKVALVGSCQDVTINEAKLISIREHTEYSRAVRELMTALFTPDEMAGASVAGRNGKKILDPKRVEAIISYIMLKYGVKKRGDITQIMNYKLRDFKQLQSKDNTNVITVSQVNDEDVEPELLYPTSELIYDSN